MKAIRTLAPILYVFLSLACVSAASGQDNTATTTPLVPPALLQLVRQEIENGRAVARQKLLATVAQECDRFEVPYSWIDLQSFTGRPQVLLFNAFESFDQLEESIAGWKQIYAKHPEVARMKEEIQADLAGEETMIAVRRDDLGYRIDHIDFSEAHFVRVMEVHLLEGHESDFAEGAAILADAYEKIRADTPWVVYQTKLGMQSSFLIFMPLTDLRQSDTLLLSEPELRNAEGEENSKRLQQIMRDSYASTVNNLYTVSPEMSHLSKEPLGNEPGSAIPKPTPESSNEGSAAAPPAPAPSNDASGPPATSPLNVSPETHPSAPSADQGNH